MSKLRSRSPLLLLAAALTIGTIVPSAGGQTLASTAAFSGSISDPSGARVPNATVMVTSPDKGITRTFKTDAAGNFAFALLPAAAYTLTVEASGFRTFRQQGINLEVGQSASQNITLTIGSAEQIEVTAAAPLLQTENANVGAEVSTKQVTELPLNLRNVFNFVQLNSSVNNNAQQQILQGGESKAPPTKTSLSLPLVAATLEPQRSFWMAPGTRAMTGAELNTSPLPTMCRSLRFNRTHSPRSTAGALAM